MNIIQIYKQFPNDGSCIAHLEKVRWSNKPQCPYCYSTNQTPLPKESRYHCNNCNTSFSVTVGTIFHDTKLDLQKWFLAVSLILNAKKGVSSRQLSRHLEVNKDTAWRMQMQIRKAMAQDATLLKGIVEADETYIGGKAKNKHGNERLPGGQGRNTSDKIAVAGVLDRETKQVRAVKVKDVKRSTLNRIINTNVEFGASVYTDESIGYQGISQRFEHSVVLHGHGQYVKGEVHTNTLEGFWALLKRGIVGQYHKVSIKH